jgi:hypothetical protein
MRMESQCGIIFTGANEKTRRKTCHSVTLSITNSTWTYQGANLGLCDERPATNLLSIGTANSSAYSVLNITRNTIFIWYCNFKVPDICHSINYCINRDSYWIEHLTTEMVKTVRPSETSLYLKQITQRYIPEGCRLYIRCSRNFKSHIHEFIWTEWKTTTILSAKSW